MSEADDPKVETEVEWVSPFKVGDSVVLKSGGPLMTVEYINPPGDPGGPFVAVAWFDNSACIQRTQFGIDTVQVA